MLNLLLVSQSQIKEGGKKMIEFSADRIKYSSKKQAQMLIGNVVFKHEGVIINCDSAYRFNNNTLEAYNHIIIRKGDSLTITGDLLKYDGNKKLAGIEGNVVCVEKDMTLTTPVMKYDVKNSVASYFGGGTIVNKDNILISKNGYYYSVSKTVAFRYNVKLTNPQYTMLCDTLNYNTATKTACFMGPTDVIAKENKLHCENGWYDTENEKSHLNTNAHIKGIDNELIADSIYYDRKMGYGKAFGCVKIIDTTNHMIIHGDLAEHFEKKNTSLVTGNALMIREFKNDSLLLFADTLLTVQKSDTIKETKDTILISAYRHIQFFKDKMVGTADSLNYTSYDSTMILYHDPIMWSDSTQLNASEIRVHFANNKLHAFELLGGAFIITQEDSVKFNQIKGKEVRGYFANDSLRKIEVLGNAQVAYYIKNDKKKLIAFNKTESKSINILFHKGEMDRITFIDKPKAAMIPLNDVNPEQERFKGFSWNPQRKPRSKAELLDF